MSTLDKRFYNEVNSMSRICCELNKNFTLKKLPLPKFDNKPLMLDKVYIRGIQEEYYSKLNSTAVSLAKRGTKLTKRRANYDGKFQVDSNGNFIKDEIQLPSECVGVISDININVPSKFKAKEGFKYIDYTASKDSVYYVYTIPKKYCYPVNQSALIISDYQPTRGSYYMGYCIKLRTGHDIFLYTTDYSLRVAKRYKSSRIILTKTGLNFNEEIIKIRNYWLKIGLLLPLDLTNLEEPVKVPFKSNEFTSNCCFRKLTAVKDREEFQGVSETPLGVIADITEIE